MCAALFLGGCEMQPRKENDPTLIRFWAVDFTKKFGQRGYFYEVNTRKLYEGDKCEIYAETNSGIIAADAEQFARKYDDKIYDLMLEYFCDKKFNVGNTIYEDTLEYAYSLVSNQDKLIILLLDIKDGHKPEGGYIAGYFDPNNLYYNRYSNLKNMIYIDTDPGIHNHEEMYSTFAHELQHLINYVTSIRKRPNGQSPYPLDMDTWIDEGLSLIAEYLYQGKPLKSRIDWFNKDKFETIVWGNNFYVWDNYRQIDDDTILDDYATAYLFFQWLYLQAGEQAPALLKEIVSSSYCDYRALTTNENIASIITDGDDWETLLRTWLAANYINDPDNEYGYKGNAAFNDINIKTYGFQNEQNENDDESENEFKIELFPGEGVYSTINSEFTSPVDDSGKNLNIRYAGLQKAVPFVSFSGSPYTSELLLTFNKNTAGKALETGYFTGEDTPAAMVTHASERSIAGFSYPVRIDARDLMRRNGARIQSAPSKARRPAHEH